MNEKMTEEINEKMKIISRQQEQMPKGGMMRKKLFTLQQIKERETN